MTQSSKRQHQTAESPWVLGSLCFESLTSRDIRLRLCMILGFGFLGFGFGIRVHGLWVSG